MEKSYYTKSFLPINQEEAFNLTPRAIQPFVAPLSISLVSALPLDDPLKLDLLGSPSLDSPLKLRPSQNYMLSRICVTFEECCDSQNFEGLGEQSLLQVYIEYKALKAKLQNLFNLEQQMVRVLEFVAKKESLHCPHGFTALQVLLGNNRGFRRQRQQNEQEPNDADADTNADAHAENCSNQTNKANLI
ncbi:hypothetical protein HID58_007003 [Brassica napus]|uniref:Uncharacterized protein n=1 Tax=Brassica napus TaxID=3708 RepID=A0ABQ8ED25_BRANA|nr:hypothetical protein HID58_007003 [Brassica napus]